MAGEFVSVAEAAAMLDVHPQRVHERIREGSLPAEKVGHQWAVERDDLRRIMNHTGPGRPLSSKPVELPAMNEAQKQSWHASVMPSASGIAAFCTPT